MPAWGCSKELNGNYFNIFFVLYDNEEGSRVCYVHTFTLGASQMDRHSLDAVDMLKIAAQHAYCAEHLLKQNGEVMMDNQLSVDALLPITSLMYQAF